MKNVREYEKTMTGGFLNENEVELLKVVVKKICDNHPDDDFWKINDSIKRIVSLQLSLIEADQSYEEERAAEQARIAAEEEAEALKEEEERKRKELIKEDCEKFVDSELRKNDFCSYEHDLT